MSQRLRIFVSSPGDVQTAREIAALTIERLAQDYARFFRIEPYLWEYEAMVASGHFEDSIEPPSAFDVVVLILWSRLGTLLPERTAVREYRGIDGRAPVTGTEWEFEEAFQAAKRKGAPDLLVYRSQKPAPFDTQEPRHLEEQLKQLQALNGFWERHFANQGAFIGAYTLFTSDAEFAVSLEHHLRKLLERRIAALGTAHSDSGTRVWMQAPFRGLEPYEFEHAPIFFGQDEALSRAMLQLTANAEGGAPFLLVIGASGSGKSSLVKAGIVPKLFVPRRVSCASFLRRVVFRPSDARNGEDMFDALARQLTSRQGDQEGLPELVSHGQTVADLAAHLRHSTAEPGYPFGMALGQIAGPARQSGRMLEYEAPKLVLVIDQLEELFTNERISTDERRRFIGLLAGFVRSGLVWVIATIRRDFWHFAVEAPELLALSDGNGRLELAPPTPAQLSQMIRRPAEAAGVNFEIHDTTGVPLNDVIAEEVAREPGALPLLSYLLDQLYRSDVLEAGGQTLTYATYERLGKLDGAIATRAEAVLADCAPEDRQALGSVLFSLVQMGSAEGDIERAIARRVPLSTFAPGTPQRRLVDRLLDPDARLLVSDADRDGAPTVRVAHEALISRWGHARDFVQSNAEALKVRRRIEERFFLWHSRQRAARVETAGRLGARLAAWRSRFGREEGLLTDIDLTDGRRLLREHRADTEAQLVAYVERSVADQARLRTRSIRILTAVTAVVTVLAVIASGAGWIASRKQEEAVVARDTAQRRQKQAEGLVEFMLGDLNDKLREVGRFDILDAVNDKAMVYFQSLPTTDVTEEASAQRAKALERIGSARLDEGHLQAAIESFDAAVQLAASLAAGAPLDLARQLAYAEILSFRGMSYWSQRQLDAAQRDFESAEAVLSRARSNPHAENDPRLLYQLAVLANNTGHVLEDRGQLDGAARQYVQMLRLSQQWSAVDPDNSRSSEHLGVAHNNLGKLALLRGDLVRAVVEYGADDAIESALSARRPDDSDRLESMLKVRAILGRTLALAGQVDVGTEDLQQAVTIALRLAKVDARNSTVQEDVALYGVQLARLRRLKGNLAAATMLSERSVAIFDALTQQDASNAGWQREAAEARLERAAELMAEGHLDAARAAVRASMAVLAPLVVQAPNDHARLLAAEAARLVMATLTADAAAAKQLRLQVLQSTGRVQSGADDPRLLALTVEALLATDQVAEARKVIDRLWRIGYRDPALVGLLHRSGIGYPVNVPIERELQAALSAPQLSAEPVR